MASKKRKPNVTPSLATILCAEARSIAIQPHRSTTQNRQPYSNAGWGWSFRCAATISKRELTCLGMLAHPYLRARLEWPKR